MLLLREEPYTHEMHIMNDADPPIYLKYGLDELMSDGLNH
jgi:hypothetical protein